MAYVWESLLLKEGNKYDPIDKFKQAKKLWTIRKLYIFGNSLTIYMKCVYLQISLQNWSTDSIILVIVLELMEGNHLYLQLHCFEKSINA